IILAVTIALVTHAAMYGPQAAFIAELFATELRYSGASMGYQVAGIFGGALAPIIAIKLVAHTHSTLSVSWYVLATLAITALALDARDGRCRAPGTRQVLAQHGQQVAGVVDQDPVQTLPA